MSNTLCPRERRVLAALADRGLGVRDLADAAGVANPPNYVMKLRHRGWRIKCVRVAKFDRDGKKCWPGIYMFVTEDERRRAILSLKKETPASVAVSEGPQYSSKSESTANLRGVQDE
jgi:hypothetical protein